VNGLPKKMAPVSGKRCLSSASTPESGTTSIITQNSKNERRKMKPKTFVFYVKEAPLSKKQICSPQDMYERMKDLVKADQETFWVIGFNHLNKEIYNDCLFIGGIDKCMMDNNILFKRLITVGASSFIIVHNHPGGECYPSEEDISLTNGIKAGSEILNLNFFDHIIISDNGYYSFKYYDLLS
jgi:DNA repair protein RadC